MMKSPTEDRKSPSSILYLRSSMVSGLKLRRARYNMTEKEVLSRFPAHRLEGALRFSAHEVRVGTEAPDFALPDLSRKIVRFSSYRGKSNAVLVFGSVTCGATATQLRAGKPSIRSLYARYKKKGFEFSLSTPRNPTLEKKFRNPLRSKSERRTRRG